MEEPSSNMQRFEIINPPTLNQQNQNPKEEKEDKEDKEEKKAKSCYFPSAYTILICLEFIVFILTYIIPKGKFDTIEYKSETNKFEINYYNRTSTPEPKEREANQTTLDELKIKIDLDKFTSGLIKKPISIPGSYKVLEDEKNANFFQLFIFPILGLIDSSGIGFFLMMIGGCINILIEMDALKSGMEALSRITHGHEIILLIATFVLVSIGGTTFGMAEEILSFYPVLMPIFLKSGLDGALAGASLYFGSIVGTMFSTVNVFAVGIGSYSAGINFVDGIVFRVIGFILVDVLVIGYFLFYYTRVKKDPSKSAVYDIKEELNDKFLKDKKEQNAENPVKITDEEALLKEAKEEETSQFTLIQKISLILFALCFVMLIIGVTALGWWFEQIAAIFLVFGIILIFLVRKGEVKGIELFTKGAGDFVSVILIIGIARGINITLEKGLISDTILNGLTHLVDGLPKVLFAIIMFIIFIILGVFVQSSSGLAVLSMPVIAPLADEVGCSRAVVVNAYMFGQNFISLITPTGLTLIVLQLVGMKYNHWLKFIWIFVIVLFVYLIIMIIISSLVE